MNYSQVKTYSMKIDALVPFSQLLIKVIELTLVSELIIVLTP